MNTNSLLIKMYEDVEVFFVEDGWFNATKVAVFQGKKPYDWLTLPHTLELILALLETLESNPVATFHEINRLWKDLKSININSDTRQIKVLELVKKSGLVKTRRGSPNNGGGTWMHPKLAVHFGYWVSAKFAVWMGEKIEEIIKQQETPQFHFLEEIWHPQGFDFKVVQEAEDLTCKVQRNNYTSLLNRLGFTASPYKRQITDAVNEILMGLKARDFRQRFLIPPGSRRRTRLLFNYNLRRATNEVELVACQRIADEEITDWDTILQYVIETAIVVSASYTARGYRLVENVPSMRRRTRTDVTTQAA